jgi:hypothetical protein
VNKQNQESCEGALTPPTLPSANCKDYGSYGLLGGCKEKCTATGSECKASVDDASGEKRFCCPPAASEPSPETGCTPVQDNTECNEVRRENPEKTFTYADGQCCLSGMIPPDGELPANCGTKQTGTCAGNDVKFSYYKSKATKCPPGQTEEMCYGLASTSCNDVGWLKLHTDNCVEKPSADCEPKQANCEKGNANYQGTNNKFSYFKSKSCTGTKCYSSVDPNNCTQSTWNEIANHYCTGAPLTEEPVVPGEENPTDPETPPNLLPPKVDINELGSTQCEVKLPGGGNKIYSCDSSNTVRQEEKCTNGKWDGVKQATTVCAQWFSFAGKKCFFYYLTPQNGQVFRSQASYNSIEEALSASPCQIAQGQTDSFSVEIRIPKEKNIQEANICIKDGGDYECKAASQTGTEDGHTKVYSTQYTLGTAAYNRLLKVYVIDANGNTYYGIPVEKTLLINSMDQTPDYSFSINWN